MPLNWSEIPVIILAACGLLVLLFLFYLVRMLLEANSAVRQCRQFAAALPTMRPQLAVNRRDGMQLSDLEQLRAVADRWPARQQAWWRRLDSSLEQYTRPNGNPGFFVTEQVDELLSWSEVIDQEYHASFHEAVPGILTGLGLMATFIAILTALQGVHVDVRGSAETVQGIGALINGLSGKFLSSIVALFLAVAFTIAEKGCERRLMRAYAGLIEQTRQVFPALTPARVMIDTETLSIQQVELLRGIYGEVLERAGAREVRETAER